MTSSSVRAPVTVKQGHVAEDARDWVDIRGLGEFVNRVGVGIGQSQRRKARSDHEA
ncbi:hypothetical protein O3656_09225 [Pauljensenia sp. 27098_8_83]